MDYIEAKEVLREVFEKPFEFTMYESRFDSNSVEITFERNEVFVEGTTFILKMFTNCVIADTPLPTEWRTEQISVSDYYLESVFKKREALKNYFMGFRKVVEDEFIADALDTFGLEIVRKENK